MRSVARPVKLDPVLENLFSSSTEAFQEEGKKRDISVARFINFYDETYGVIGDGNAVHETDRRPVRLKKRRRERCDAATVKKIRENNRRKIVQ